MTWLWIVGLAWPVTAAAVALVMARTVRVADSQEAPGRTVVGAPAPEGSRGRPVRWAERMGGRRRPPAYRQRAARSCLPPGERRPTRTSDRPR